MLIKLGIIAGIVILGGMIFSTEIDNIFPATSATVFDSLMNDVTNFGTIASNSVEQRIDESIDKIVDKTSNSITNEISEAGDNITYEISEAKDSSQKTINEEILNFDLIESIKNVFTDTTSWPSTSSLITYEILFLSIKQQSNDNILLQVEKEIFSGIFFTSMFEIIVNDATGFLTM